MTAGARSGLRSARGLIALVLFAALALGFAVESLSPRLFDSVPSTAQELRVGDDYLLLATEVDRERAAAVHIGLALRNAAGGELEEVIAPHELIGLATVPDVVVDGRLVSILNARTISNLTGGAYRLAEYDPRLSSEDLGAILEQGSVEVHPGGILVVVADDEGEAAEGHFVLHADESNSAVYVVPRALSPLSADEDVVVP